MEKYFSLNSNGRLYTIGTFKTWSEAEEAAEKLTGTETIKKYKHGSIFTKRPTVLWIFNEAEARDWAEFLNKELENKPEK